MKTRNLVAWMITLAIWAAIVVPCFAGTDEMQKAQDAVVSFVNTVTASGVTPADCYKAGQDLEAIRKTLTRDEQSLIDSWSKERFGSALKPLPQWKREAVLLGMDAPSVQTVADVKTDKPATPTMTKAPETKKGEFPAKNFELRFVSVTDDAFPMSPPAAD